MSDTLYLSVAKVKALGVAQEVIRRDAMCNDEVVSASEDLLMRFEHHEEHGVNAKSGLYPLYAFADYKVFSGIELT